MLITWLVNQVTNQAKIQGWVIHRRPLIKYTVIFGPLKIESPYLWNKKLQKGIRLYQAVEAMNLKKKLKHSLIDALVCLIDRGEVQQVITRFRNYQAAGVKEIKNLVNYLDRFQNCVHYRKFQQLALPIGSGEIESAHRYIPQKRLKIPGATWHPDTINPMLALRVLRANDWWSDFWSESELISIHFKKAIDIFL